MAMAGILFTDGKMVLGGYNNHSFYITGIGGKKKGNELPYQTAVREMVEELFEIEEIPEDLLTHLENILNFDTLIGSKYYDTFVMSFDVLKKITGVVNQFSVKSKVYDTIPESIMELIFMRKQVENAEFTHLVLVPCMYNVALDKNYMSDIYAFKNCIKISR